MELEKWDELKRNYVVATAEVPVITLFTMPNCRPCKVLEQILIELKDEYEEEILIGKSLASDYKGDHQISMVPRVYITTNGRLFEEMSMMSKQQLMDRIDAAIEEMENE